MAKKSRRARTKLRSGVPASKPAVVKQNQNNAQIINQETGIKPASVATTVKANQYEYVTADLMRIGIIGGSLILILIILTFILR